MRRLSISKTGNYSTDTQHQQRARRLNERVRIARDHNRTLVGLGTAPNSIAIVFVPLFNNDNQEAIPFACLMTGEQPLRPPEERLLYDLTARELLSTLLFFEGIRQIIATGCGVRCPVRSMEWAERAVARMKGDKLPTCCGRNKELIALWEAGNKGTAPNCAKLYGKHENNTKGIHTHTASYLIALSRGYFEAFVLSSE
jgi:hypothetical protein